ncbi:MAG: glycine zipper family protein [Nitrospiraceae bacterium]
MMIRLLIDRRGRAGAATSLLAVAVILLAGCSRSKPILYPNAHFQDVGETVAEQDIEFCGEAAEAAGAEPDSGKTGETATRTATGAAMGSASGAAGGAVAGAIRGNPGRGAMTGAAAGAAGGATHGLLRSLFSRRQPSQVYKQYVNRCLRERGYDVVGWK